MDARLLLQALVHINSHRGVNSMELTEVVGLSIASDNPLILLIAKIDLGQVFSVQLRHFVAVKIN